MEIKTNDCGDIIITNNSGFSIKVEDLAYCGIKVTNTNKVPCNYIKCDKTTKEIIFSDPEPKDFWNEYTPLGYCIK